MFKDYAKFYNLIYKKRSYETEARMVYRWANHPEIIVDLGCGTGLHHKYWNCTVIGIDKSWEMLKKAKWGKDRIYIKSDIEENIQFHYAHCYTALFNVIGYCNLEKIISQMKQPKSGVFIFDVWDYDKFEKEGFEKRIKNFSWGRVIINPFCNELNEWIIEIELIPKKGNSFKEFHSVVPYRLSEIEMLCKKYGYTGIRKDAKGWTVYYKLVKQ